MKYFSVMILLCYASTLAAETPASSQLKAPSKLGLQMSEITKRMPSGTVKRKVHEKMTAQALSQEIMELGRKYWGLLRADPYMSEPVGEIVSLEQQLTLLKKSLRYLKKEKATLDQKFERLHKQKTKENETRVSRMINLLEPSRIMCDRVIRDYSRQIKVLESVRRSTAHTAVVTPQKSITPAVKGAKG